jgi:hypothetical protein
VSASSFVASLVSSLAWPAVVVAILVIFHGQFGTMLERLARVRIGAAGADADGDWNQTETVIRQSLSGAWPGPAAGSEVERPPQGLVEDRWQALSDEVRGIIRPGGSLSEAQLAHADFDQLMEAALRAGLLDAATVRALDGLRHLRNLARANSGLTPRQAQEFAVLADAVSYSMRLGRGSVWPAA